MEENLFKPKSYEATLILFAKLWCGFMSIMYLFAQGFNGVNSIMATFISICGLLAILPYKNKKEGNNITKLILILCVLGVLGITYEIVEFYITNITPGNDIALGFRLSFISAFFVIAYYRNYKKMPNKPIKIARKRRVLGPPNCGGPLLKR